VGKELTTSPVTAKAKEGKIRKNKPHVIQEFALLMVYSFHGLKVFQRKYTPKTE